jgi:hypothetical protein
LAGGQGRSRLSGGAARASLEGLPTVRQAQRKAPWIERRISGFRRSYGSDLLSFHGLFEKLSALRFLATALNPKHIHASPTTRRRSFYLAIRIHFVFGI